MDEDTPGRWQRLKNLRVSRKDLSKRMRRAQGVTIRHARKFVFRRWENAREVSRHIVIWVVAVGILITATGVQLMWYQQSYRMDTQASDGTYAEAVLGPVDTLNPLFASTSAEESASHLLFSRLLTYDTSGHLNNDLATNVAVSAGGTEYTVKIRSDAKWHDGTTVTAYDVLFTIGLLKNPAVRSTIPADWSSIKVSAVDDTTLSFTLPTVIAAFPHALTFPILPKHILANVEPNAIRENDFSRAPIGSGPFSLRLVQDIDATTGRKIIHLERNDAYYKGIAKLERFQLHVYSTSDAIVHALSSGEVNAAADVASASTDQINKNNYTVSNVPIASGVYALLNTVSPALKDKAVRQALQRSTNLASIRAAQPAGTPTLDLPFINGQVTGDLPKVASFDPEAAKQLLDSAGWHLEGSVRKKDGTPLHITAVTTKDPQYEKTLEMIAGEWRDIGVTVDTQIYDPKDVTQAFVTDVLQKRNFDVLIRALPIGADPDVLPSGILHRLIISVAQISPTIQMQLATMHFRARAQGWSLVCATRNISHLRASGSRTYRQLACINQLFHMYQVKMLVLSTTKTHL